MKAISALIVLTAATLASAQSQCLGVVSQIPSCGVRGHRPNNSNSLLTALKGLLLIIRSIRRRLCPNRPLLPMWQFSIIRHPERRLRLHCYGMRRYDRTSSHFFCSGCLLLRRWRRHSFGYTRSDYGWLYSVRAWHLGLCCWAEYTVLPPSWNNINRDFKFRWIPSCRV